MRRIHVVAFLATVITLAALSNCSKKAASPTAPAPNPICSLSPTSLSFGTVTIGSSATLQFTLTNSGTGTLSGTVTDTSSRFTLIGPVSYSLGAGQATSFTVRFTPAGVGAASCTLNSGSTQCGDISCSGTGQSATPVCAITPTMVEFGSSAIGSTSDRSFDVANTGGGTLTGTITGASGDFVLLDTSFSLPAGERASMRMKFTPSTTGAEACTLSVGSAGCSPVVCRGSGFLDTHDYCSVAVTSGTVDFGEVSVGHTATRTVSLKNFSADFYAQGDVSEFCTDFSNGIGSFNLGPGITLTGTVQFTPSRVGQQSCTMPIACWMNGSGTNPGVQSAISCTGVGVGGTPGCQLSTTRLDFGSVVVGQSKDLPLVLTNTGTGPLSGIAGPSHCSEFVFLEPTAYDLSPGQSTTLTLRFTPTQVGHTITCTQITMGLDCAAFDAVGSGVAPPSCAVSTTSLDLGTVAVGQSKDLTFDVMNAGGGTLCGAISESCPDFAIVVNPSYCITPPAFVRVTVRFTPTTSGLQQCIVSPGPGCAPITVSGTGS